MTNNHKPIPQTTRKPLLTAPPKPLYSTINNNFGYCDSSAYISDVKQDASYFMRVLILALFTKAKTNY